MACILCLGRGNYVKLVSALLSVHPIHIAWASCLRKTAIFTKDLPNFFTINRRILDITRPNFLPCQGVSHPYCPVSSAKKDKSAFWLYLFHFYFIFNFLLWKTLTFIPNRLGPLGWTSSTCGVGPFHLATHLGPQVFDWLPWQPTDWEKKMDNMHW